MIRELVIYFYEIEVFVSLELALLFKTFTVYFANKTAKRREFIRPELVLL